MSGVCEVPAKGVFGLVGISELHFEDGLSFSINKRFTFIVF